MYAGALLHPGDPDGAAARARFRAGETPTDKPPPTLTRHGAPAQDLKYLRDEVSATTTNEKFGRAKADSLRQRLERQLLIVKKRCEALTMKASEINSENQSVRLCIDDLRKEKLTHRELIQRMKAKVCLSPVPCSWTRDIAAACALCTLAITGD